MLVSGRVYAKIGIIYGYVSEENFPTIFVGEDGQRNLIRSGKLTIYWYTVDCSEIRPANELRLVVYPTRYPKHWKWQGRRPGNKRSFFLRHGRLESWQLPQSEMDKGSNEWSWVTTLPHLPTKPSGRVCHLKLPSRTLGDHCNVGDLLRMQKVNVVYSRIIKTSVSMGFVGKAKIPGKKW